METALNYKKRDHVDLHVIDAIDKTSFENGGSDAAILREALQGEPIHIVPHVARDLQSFSAVIVDIAQYRPGYDNPRKSIPYVHVSCHGTKESLLIGERDTMAWESLSEFLHPLQERTDYNLPISLSSCWGYHGANLAYKISEKYGKKRPYYSLVGPIKEEKILLLGQAFALFYRHLLIDFKNMKKSIALSNKNGPVNLGYTYGSCVTY